MTNKFRDVACKGFRVLRGTFVAALFTLDISKNSTFFLSSGLYYAFCWFLES